MQGNSRIPDKTQSIPQSGRLLGNSATPIVRKYPKLLLAFKTKVVAEYHNCKSWPLKSDLGMKLLSAKAGIEIQE